MLAAIACRSPTQARPSAAPHSGRPASDDELRAYCASSALPCRENVHILLRRADGTTFERTFAILPPAVQEGVLSLFPGETVYVEAGRKGDALVLSRVVQSPEHPDRTLTLRFTQAEEQPGMTLVVESPFDEPVKFDLGMMLLDGEPGRIVKTSSCPVGPRMKSLEMWPHPIFQLVAVRFRFVASDGGLRCE